MCSFSFSNYVLGSIHSGVRRNEIQTSNATAQDAPNHLARRVFHCGYIFLVEMLTQWPPNMHVARYRLLYGAFVRNPSPLLLSESPMTMTSDSHLFFFITGVRRGFRAGLWGFSPNSLAETSQNGAGSYFKRKKPTAFIYLLLLFKNK